MSVSTGQTSAEQASTREWSPFSGMAKTRRVEGTTAAALAAKESELQSQSWPYKVKDLGVKWEIEWTEQNTLLSIPGLDVVTPLADNWELQAATSEKDIMESDVALIAALNDHDRDYLKQFNLGKLEYTDTQAAIALDGTESGQKVLDLLNAGIKSRVVEQQVLRRTRIVSNKYAIKDSLTNVGKILKASNIATYENVPTELMFNLPSDYAALSTIDGLTRHYGWLKRFPTVLQLAEGKWQINLEYDWGLWSDDLYTFVT